ncbi:hypothetical protein [Bacillus smithii]|uniref:hypothetical protein n=1 Tax=Bacillus smithii TaxID=1479 RepID=UPI0030C9BC29
MLTKNTQMNRDQIEMIALDQLVPADHLVRKIEAAIDFSFIYSLTGPFVDQFLLLFIQPNI